jgi:hypothetical protein
VELKAARFFKLLVWSIEIIDATGKASRFNLGQRGAPAEVNLGGHS